MTDKERLVARLTERVRIHDESAARATDPIHAAVSRAWADSARACRDDAEELLPDDDFDAVEALVGGYVP